MQAWPTLQIPNLWTSMERNIYNHLAQKINHSLPETSGLVRESIGPKFKCVAQRKEREGNLSKCHGNLFHLPLLPQGIRAGNVQTVRTSSSVYSF